MAFIIDPSSVSFSSILTDLEVYRDSRPDSAKWNTFFEAGTGQTITEEIAALGAFLAYKVITGRRENYLQYAVNKSSVVGIAQYLGYSTFRGKNQHLTLLIVPSATMVLPRFSIVGALKDQDLVVLQDTPMTINVPVMVEVVIGTLTAEDISAPSADRAIFRFESPDVTEDLRLLLNGTEVSTSDRILDLDDDKFVVITNVLESVDVSYLNRVGSSFLYNTGDILRIEFLAKKDINFDQSDINFFYGDLTSFSTLSVYQDPEANNTTRINAPLFHETQALVRARLDFLKVFKIIDPRFVSTNQHDVTAATVELAYLNSDYSALTMAEKTDLLSILRKRMAMGIPPPLITDPVRVALPLDIAVTLRNNTENTTDLIESILVLKENILGSSINLDDIESDLEDLNSVKIARVSIGSSEWVASTSYERGSRVRLEPATGQVFELTKILYRSNSVEPAWPTTLNNTVIDKELVWKAELINPSELTTTTWSPNSIYEIRNVVVPTVPNGRQYRLADFINKSFSNSEIQNISFDVVPDDGTWRLLYNDGIHIQQTTNLAFDASALDVQNALNALECLSEVIVTGSYSSGFTVTFAGVDANKQQPQLDISDPGQNENQLISFDQVPNSGSFGLDFDGQITSSIAYNAVANDVKLALEALSNIDLVAVTGDYTNGFLIEFQGVNAKQPVTQLLQTLLASPGTDEVQTISFDSVPDSGTWRIFQGLEYTPELSYNANNTVIQSAINSLSNLSTVVVSGSYSSGLVFTFQDADGKKPQVALAVSNSGQNSKQKITFSLLPDFGTWRLDYNGDKTSYLQFNASTTQIQTALNALSGVTGALVTGDYASGLFVEFAGSNGLQTQPLLTSSDPGVDEVQTLTYSTTPDRGSYRLVFGSESTALLSSSATASDIKTALEDLPSIDLVTVSGNAAFGFSISFQGSLSKTDVALLTVASNSLFDDQIAEETSITTIANTSNVLDGKAFWLYDASGSVSFWIDSDNNGTPEPPISLLADRSVRISSILNGDSANDVATKVKNAIAADSKFTSSVAGNIATAVNAVSGARTDSNAQTSGFTITTTVQGTTVGVTPVLAVLIAGLTADDRLVKADQVSVIVIEEVQPGLKPANSLLNSSNPVVVTVTESTPGEDPVSNLERSSIPVDVVITTPLSGDYFANNLQNSGGPVVVTISTIVDAASAEPTWPTVLGQRVYDGSIIWQATELNDTPDIWQPGVNYKVGDFVAPSVPVEDLVNSVFLMFQTVGFLGKSDTSTPNFPTTLGTSIIDNKALWTTRDPSASPQDLDFNEYFDVIQTVTLKGP